MATQEIQSLANELLKLGFDANKISSTLGTSLESTIIGVALILSIVFIWTYVWKAIALYKSAKNNHRVWFIIIFMLLPVTTAGILEILYIYVFSKIKLEDKPVKKIKPELKKRVRKK